ncbi:MAG: cation-translocating P-type ATPase [Ethanoligenens sp.]
MVSRVKADAAVHARGLSEREAKKRLSKYGPNVFAHGKKVRPLGIFLAQFQDILIIILLVSTALSVFMGEMTEAIAILLIVILNAVMGFVQEYRTEKTLDALKNMAAPLARVVRDGESTQVPAADVVPGDLLELDAGDRVAADAALVEGAGVQVDESLLTGESVPVEKRTEKADKVFMGTMMTKGRAFASVVATGMQTEMGKIAGMISDIKDEQTPLQKRLAELGKFIAIACLVICAVVTATGILRGEPVMNMVIIGISLAVAAVPEGLPAIVTIALALGVGRMLKRNALIRKLTAVETLGCASVICSDKTGTLTENKMTVRRVFTPLHDLAVTGSGFNTAGDFLQEGKKVRVRDWEDVARTMEIAASCNNAELRFSHGLFHKGRVEVVGDPTEAALLVMAAKAGITREIVDRTYETLLELPFDSERKCMSVVVRVHGRKRLFVKGAPDVILEKCRCVHTGKGDELLTNALRARIRQANDEMADNALRVLAMAWRDLPENIGDTPEMLETGLTFAGLAGMIDPPRKEAFTAVRKCVRAGIRPVMITGDHKKTAAAIARELGILRGSDGVLTGSELDAMSDAELMRAVKHTSVFARVSPGHKLRIVRSFKRNGNVVAMTGDGVNDAPAVKEADIGVSMGKTGTDVTKEASAIILLDDNFASMVAAVEEGRVIYSNIRKFIRYLLSCNIGEILTMFIGMLMGLPIVLQPIQILWVNLVTDGLPAIALGLEPPEDDVMEQKPRGIDESVFSNGLLGMMIFRGCLIGLSTLGAFISVLRLSGDLTMARTAAFLTLVAVQLVHVFECKSERLTLPHIPLFNNIWLVAAALVSGALMLVVICVPTLRPVFGTTPLGFAATLRVVGYTLIGPVLSSILFGGKSRKHARVHAQ